MVTPITPGMAPPPTVGRGAYASQANQTIEETRRLLLQNRLTGAAAMRVSNMLALAEQRNGNGNPAQAERIARNALRMVNNIIEPPIPGSNPPGEAEDGGTAGEETQDAAGGTDAPGEIPGPMGERETTTYRDGSDDGGISYRFSTPLSDAQAPFAVRQHELSHIRRETSEAIMNGQRVLASVTVNQGIDPATGDPYVGGGRARIVIFPDIEAVRPTGLNLDVTG